MGIQRDFPRRNLLRYHSFITIVEDCSAGDGNDRVDIEIVHYATLPVLVFV